MKTQTKISVKKQNQLPIITLSNVWKEYKSGETTVTAVHNINLSINSGDFVVIIGPSGSGKSTMMNLVGALDTPTRGHIFLDGKDIATLGENELAQLRGRKIGFIFQQFNLIQTLTALQNVELPMMFAGISKEQRFKTAQALLIQVGLSHRLNHLPAKMSGGEQQRVAIARALANSPGVILADEPTGNLDSKTGSQIIEMLQSLHRSGKTIILITHDAGLVKYAERVIELKDGQIINDNYAK